MDMEWVGVAAGILTTCAFLPQVAKTVRSRSAGDLSWIWLIMMCTGVFLWMLYGYFKGSPSVFYANVFTLICLLILVYVKGWMSKPGGGKTEYITVRRKVRPGPMRRPRRRPPTTRRSPATPPPPLRRTRR